MNNIDVRIFSAMVAIFMIAFVVGKIEIIEALLYIISMTLVYILLVLCRIKNIFEKDK